MLFIWMVDDDGDSSIKDTDKKNRCKEEGSIKFFYIQRTMAIKIPS